MRATTRAAMRVASRTKTKAAKACYSDLFMFQLILLCLMLPGAAKASTCPDAAPECNAIQNMGVEHRLAMAEQANAVLAQQVAQTQQQIYVLQQVAAQATQQPQKRGPGRPPKKPKQASHFKCTHHFLPCADVLFGFRRN